MKILATDLDRTLLPNGSWPNVSNSIEQFNTYTKEQNLFVVYVTGRNLKLTKKAIKTYGIRYPYILIGDVGTTIRYYKNNKWIIDSGWTREIKSRCPKFNADKIEKCLSNINGLERQENENQNELKQSYFFDSNLREKIENKITKHIFGKYDESIIYSFDPILQKELVDVLPHLATKKDALIYITNKYKLSFDDIMYCGDSGNDILPLSCGFYSVIVKNGDNETITKTTQIMTKQNTINRLYVAKGIENNPNFNGYYASGILEGAIHFGFIKKPQKIQISTK